MEINMATDEMELKPWHWLLVQTLAVFVGLSSGVYLITGDWKGAVIIAAGAGAFLIALYAVTGILLIKGTDR
jgi:hypothetical protein